MKHHNRKKYRIPANVIFLNIFYSLQRIEKGEIMKILFCTDGSKISFNALRNFAGWQNEAIVDVICVIDWTFLPDEVSIEEDGFANSCANVADTILNYAEKEIKSLNMNLGRKIKHCGSAIDSILEQLKTEYYDLVLLGSHGKKGLQKWLGSVSQEIVNSSKDSSYITKDANNKERILFTTDGSPYSYEVVRQAINHLHLYDKKIYICTVNEDPDLLFLEGTLDTNWLLEIEKQQNIFAAKAVKTIESILEENDLKSIESAILSGNPTQKILDFAKAREIDLIVIGERKKSKMDNFLTGSISRRVLENTRSDVLIIKES